jgi:DNA-binding beta-propeller fold protein YncE
MEHDQIAASLRLALDREAARHEISAGAWSQIERRLRRRTWRRTGIAAACVAIVAAAATVTPYLWHTISGPVVGYPHPQPAPQLVLISRTHLSRGVTDIAAGYGGVWVIGSGVIYRVDPATGRIVATIPVSGVGELNHIAAGAGAVWATSDDRGHVGVYRIDPRTNRVTSLIRLQPNPIGITIAFGRVWVTEPKSGPGIVLRIDPRTNRVSGPPIRVGTGAGKIVAGSGTLWVTNGNGNGSVSRINPATGAVVRTLVNIPGVTAVGAGSLWVTPNRGGIQRVDPVTGQVTATFRLPTAVRVTFWAGSAWVSNEPPGTLIRIDPTSNRIIGKAAPAGTSPTYIAATRSGLWVVDFTTGDLLHLAFASAVK